MTILVDKNTRLIVHGITGREGSRQTRTMMDYGTRVVAGIVPGKGGQTFEGIPVFNTAREALAQTDGNTSIFFVPKAFVLNAAVEAIEAEVPLIVCLAEGVPVHDVLKIKKHQKKSASIFIGPNTPGLISPGVVKVGGMPHKVYTPGSVGVVSRSGTLSYEMVNMLSASGIGQSTCVGIGGDRIPGFTFVDALKLFKDDDQTEMIVMIGEVGGIGEIEAAKYIKAHFNKPVFALIGGLNAPPGKKMGHAGAVVAGADTTAAAKMEALQKAGAFVADSPHALRDAVRSAI
ncbi:MAG: succinate--CoA ligase subunit alpha [Thermodesulfobacteriota bacterium]